MQIWVWHRATVCPWDDGLYFPNIPSGIISLHELLNIYTLFNSWLMFGFVLADACVYSLFSWTTVDSSLCLCLWLWSMMIQHAVRKWPLSPSSHYWVRSTWCTRTPCSRWSAAGWLLRRSTKNTLTWLMTGYVYKKWSCKKNSVNVCMCRWLYEGWALRCVGFLSKQKESSLLADWILCCL